MVRVRITSMILGAACMAAASSAAAHMPAFDFLRRADALRARGPIAFFSPDLKRLQKAAEDAGDELHNEHLADVAAGRRTDYCSPVAKYLGPRELIEGLHAVPAVQLRHMDIKQAMRAVFERNYPCSRATASR